MKSPSSRQQLGNLAVAGIAFTAMFVWGSQRMREPAPMKIDLGPDKAAFSSGKATEKGSAEKQAAKPPEAPIKEIVVHVAGAVARPGLVRVPNGARVHEAIQAAGGPTSQAEIHRINLAEKLEDGNMVTVPKKGDASLVSKSGVQRRPTTRVSSVRRSTSKKSEGKDKEKAKPKASEETIKIVNLNFGTLEELESLPGVGPSTALKIIEYREKHGGFTSVDELLLIPGLGVNKLEAMRSRLTL